MSGAVATPPADLIVRRGARTRNETYRSLVPAREPIAATCGRCGGAVLAQGAVRCPACYEAAVCRVLTDPGHTETWELRARLGLLGR
jgi:hypothetical protein